MDKINFRHTTTDDSGIVEVSESQEQLDWRSLQRGMRPPFMNWVEVYRRQTQFPNDLPSALKVVNEG